MRFDRMDQRSRRRNHHQKTSWQVDLNAGREQAGLLRVDCPTKKHVNSREFLQVCDLADVVARSLSSILAAQSIKTSDELLTPSPIYDDGSLTETLKKVLDSLLKMTSLRSTGFFLLNPSGTELAMHVDLHRDGQTIPHSRRALSSSQIDQDALFGQLITVRIDEHDVADWMPEGCKLAVCVAVRSSNDPIGTLWAFDRRIRRLTNGDKLAMESVATRIGHLLEHAVLRQESADKERIYSEVEAATGNKPAELISQSLGDGAIEVASRCLSYSELGGDMSEVIVEGDRAVIGVGDASGHSLPATIIMSNVRGSLYTLASDMTAEMSSAEMMARMNDALYGVSQTHQFMTMMAGNLDAKKREFTFTNAGHPPLVFCRDGEVSLIDSHGMLLGVMKGTGYDSATVELLPGDVLACYTDGISEAADSGRRMFKPEGVAASVKRLAQGTAEEIRDGLWRDVDRHLGANKCDDDRTILVLKGN